jgi:CheY-like chemotaxis protein
VAVTGHPRPDALRIAREAGFDHLLVKPVALPELEALLGGAARVRPYVGQRTEQLP